MQAQIFTSVTNLHEIRGRLYNGGYFQKLCETVYFNLTYLYLRTVNSTKLDYITQSCTWGSLLNRAIQSLTLSLGYRADVKFTSDVEHVVSNVACRDSISNKFYESTMWLMQTLRNGEGEERDRGRNQEARSEYKFKHVQCKRQISLPFYTASLEMMVSYARERDRERYI